ncbi:MAG: RNA polymerase sigma factor [bacterium]
MKSLLKVIPLHKNEKLLVKKAKNKQRDAQRILFEVHAPKMLSVCRYYIKDLMTAEEVMLTGFLKVFQNIDSFNDKGSFEGWIRRIMIRSCIDHLRKKKVFSIELNDEVVADITESYDDHSDFDVAAVQMLIDQLPEGYKVVFMMYAIEGYKHSEIAEELGITEGTSKSQLYKARKMLQEQIQKLNNKHYGTDKF